jgi:hypothetical protein
MRDMSGSSAADAACRWFSADAAGAADAVTSLLGAEPCGRAELHVASASEGPAAAVGSLVAAADFAEPELADGGWPSSADLPLALAGTGRCDLEAPRPDISAEEFRERFILGSRPAVLRGAALAAPQRRTWTRAALLGNRSAAARARVQPLTVPYECRFGGACGGGASGGGDVSLRDFVAAAEAASHAPTNVSVPPAYIFHSPRAARDAQTLFPQGIALPRFLQLDAELEPSSEAAALLAARGGSNAAPRRTMRRRHAALLKSALSGEQRLAAPGDPAQVFFGAAGSGSPWHAHKAALNVLVFGRKRWLLRPPARALSSSAPAAGLFAAADDGRSLECTQEAGDILFVPEGWSHLVLNLQFVVGYAFEFVEVIDE